MAPSHGKEAGKVKDKMLVLDGASIHHGFPQQSQIQKFNARRLIRLTRRQMTVVRNLHAVSGHSRTGADSQR